MISAFWIKTDGDSSKKKQSHIVFLTKLVWKWKGVLRYFKNFIEPFHLHITQTFHNKRVVFHLINFTYFTDSCTIIIKVDNVLNFTITSPSWKALRLNFLIQDLIPFLDHSILYWYCYECFFFNFPHLYLYIFKLPPVLVHGGP